MFKVLGVVVSLYALYAATRGEVYARSGVTGRTISRQTSPTYFWTVIAIYLALSVALMIVF